MLQRSGLAAAAIMCSVASSHSEEEFDRIRDASSYLQMEATVCIAYYHVVKKCTPEGRKAELEARTDKSIAAAQKVAFEIGYRLGMTEDAQLSRLKMAFEDAKTLLKDDCVNIASLYVRHGKRCKIVIENGDAIYKEYLCRKDDMPLLCKLR